MEDRRSISELVRLDGRSALVTGAAQGFGFACADRLADGGGWTSFDVADITCPVIVLHGAADGIADPIHARHTAAIVPGAELRVVDDLGHFSIEDQMVPTIVDVLARQPRPSD